MCGVSISEDKTRTQCPPVYSQTSGRGGSCRGGGTGRGLGKWWGDGRNDNYGAPGNVQVVEGGKFGHDKGRYEGGVNIQENSSGGGNLDILPYRISKITVNSADVGKIIGISGHRVHKFEEESGAQIVVSDTWLTKHIFQ